MFKKTDQSGQTLLRRKKIDAEDGVQPKVYHLTTSITPVSKDDFEPLETAPSKGTLAGPSSMMPPTREVVMNVDTVKMRDNTRPNACDIVKQLSNGHTLLNLVRKRVRGFCVYCIQRNPDPNYKKNLAKIITYCSACVSSQWMCEGCFDLIHNVQQ